MCGIVYVQRKDNKPAVKQALKRYKAQKGRGSEGFGYVAIKQSGRVTELNRFAFEHELETKLNTTKHQHLLVHHRFPTSTPNVPESAHPIKVSHEELQYDYIVTHNGVISNDEALKEAHEKLGYKYNTLLFLSYTTCKGQEYSAGVQWNDSESLAIELARNIEGLTDKVAALGTIAYIVLQVEKQTQRAVALYYGTNGGNELTRQDAKEYIVIASEGGEAINDNICYRMSLPDNTLTEYTQVQMQPAFQSKAPNSLGFNLGLGRSDYDRNDTNYSSEYTYFKQGKSTRKKEEDKSIVELEEEIASIDDELIGLTGDIAFATQEGDMEEVEMYQQEQYDLMQHRETLQNLYAKKGNAHATGR